MEQSAFAWVTKFILKHIFFRFIYNIMEHPKEDIVDWLSMML